jgi:hypothetical protein
MARSQMAVDTVLLKALAGGESPAGVLKCVLKCALKYVL